MELQLPQFVTERPSHQNAVDTFRGRWICQLPAEGLQSGGMRLFSPEDRRPQMVVDVCGDIKGFKVLELGPLEAAHSYQLERLGVGSVLGIEASPEFYLKCLISKEVLGPKSRFLLGDFNRYTDECQETYDLVFACGVLYHMPDPLHTLWLISRITPRIFVWTHYYIPEPGGLNPNPVERHGFQCNYYELYYDLNLHSRGWAGVKPSANRLRKEDIVEALKFYGFDRVTITEDTPDHPGGPAFSLVGEKSAEC